MIDSIAPNIRPTGGIYLIPLAGLGYRQNFGMEPREIVAANLKALMAVRPGLDTLKKIVAASEGRLSNGTLDRIRRAANSTDIATLAEIAAIFEVEPWHLLVPHLNPRELPHRDYGSLLTKIERLMSIPQMRENVTGIPEVGTIPSSPAQPARRVAEKSRSFPKALKAATKLPARGERHGDSPISKRPPKSGSAKRR